MELAGKTFFVTGGGSGLGAACARRLASAGCQVVVADIQIDNARAVADQCGEQVLAIETDVCSEESVQGALNQTTTRFGSLQGVVNCAGILGASRVVTRDGPHDLDLFARVLQVNLVGTFNVIRLATQLISGGQASDDGERGVIVNTSSVAAFEGQIGQAAYSASKGGVAAMTLPIARELARFGIRVMTIVPGVFATPMIVNAPEKVRQSLEAQTVFPQRLGSPQEYASLVQHIAENSMLNGSVIRLDGAMRMLPK